MSAVFYLDVDRDELIRRLSGRWLCRASDDHVYQRQTHPPKVPAGATTTGAELYQREDDKPETIKARLEKQLPPMFEVVDYYADKGVLHTIDGDQPHAEVTDSLLTRRITAAGASSHVQRSPRDAQERAQIEKMAVAGALVGAVLDRMAVEVKAGMATIELDRIAEEMIRGAAASSFIGVPGRIAPSGTRCASRSTRRSSTAFRARAGSATGEIVSIDAGAIVDGWHGDGARTLHRGRGARRRAHAGRGDARARCTQASPRRAGQPPRRHLGAPSRTSPAPHGYGIVRAFVGHGIGTEMHEEPQVTNYRTGSRGRRLEPGLCLAIEPMFTLGTHEVRVKDDGWTVVTADGRWPRTGRTRSP